VYRLAYVIYMLMVSSAGVTFVFLEEFQTDYGIGSWGIGLISALAFLTAVATTLLFAPLGDRGNLEWLGGAGIVLTIGGNLWIGYATELWSLSISREALIGTTTEGSGQKIGTLLSAAVAGFIAGPGIGRHRCVAHVRGPGWAAVAAVDADSHIGRHVSEIDVQTLSQTARTPGPGVSNRRVLQPRGVRLDGR